MVNVIGKGDPPQVRSIQTNDARVRYDSGPPMVEFLQDGARAGEMHRDDIVRLQVGRDWQGQAVALDGIPIDPMP